MVSYKLFSYRRFFLSFLHLLRFIVIVFLFCMSLLMCLFFVRFHNHSFLLLLPSSSFIVVINNICFDLFLTVIFHHGFLCWCHLAVFSMPLIFIIIIIPSSMLWSSRQGLQHLESPTLAAHLSLMRRCKPLPEWSISRMEQVQNAAIPSLRSFQDCVIPG